MSRRIFRRASILGLPSHAIYGGFMAESAAISPQSSQSLYKVFSSNRGDATAVCGDIRKLQAGKRGWAGPKFKTPLRILAIQPLPSLHPTRRILFYNPEQKLSLSPSLPLSENIKSTVLQVSDLPLSLQIIPCILRPLDTFILLVEATPTTN
jgi:hypothetical protein